MSKASDAAKATTGKVGKTGHHVDSWGAKTLKQGKVRSIRETLAETASALKGRK